MLHLSFILKPYGKCIFPYENYLVIYRILFMYLHAYLKVL